MGSMIPPLIHNPVVAYRLDSDEPGVANPTRASRSVYTVVGQESRNRARLRSEALLEGRQVLLVKTDYKVRRAGSFIVPIGGHTTVVTRARPEEAEPASPLQQVPPGAEQTARPTGPVQQVPPGAERAEAEGADVQKTAELRAEQQRLEREQRETERVAEQSATYEKAQAEQRLDEIDWQLRQIERELRELGLTTRALAGGHAGAFAAHAFGATLDAVGHSFDVLV